MTTFQAKAAGPLSNLNGKPWPHEPGDWVRSPGWPLGAAAAGHKDGALTINLVKEMVV